VKSTTTHARYIINLFTHSFFIYTKKKILENVEIYDKRIVSCRCDLYQLLFPRHLMLKILCLNGSVCVCVCLNTCCDQEIKGRRPLLSPSSCFFSFSSRWEIVNSPCYYSVFTPMELLNILNL